MKPYESPTTTAGRTLQNVPVNESDPADAEIEPVFVELDWYDGPRAGVAAVAGKPNYFRAVHDYNHGDDDDDTYLVWPAGPEALAWELEQWAIFVAWNELAETGRAGTDTHAGLGGVNARYDELDGLLAAHRAVPDRAMCLRAVWRWRWRTEGGRYQADGPDYGVIWQRVSGAQARPFQ